LIHHPDGYWRLISSAERTTTLLEQFQAGGPAVLAPNLMEMNGQSALGPT
jgi:hypothetical protein